VSGEGEKQKEVETKTFTLRLQQGGVREVGEGGEYEGSR
jgi:hypothetical protein